MTDNKLKLFFLRLGPGLAEFFAPRDWVPRIPPPPVGPWKPRGRGVMPLGAAIRGFDWKE